MKDREFYYPLIAIVVLLAAFGLIVLVGSVYDAAFAKDIEICDYCGAIMPEGAGPNWADKVNLTTRTLSLTGWPGTEFKDYCNMDHMLADVTGIIDETADAGIPITIMPPEDKHWYDWIVDSYNRLTTWLFTSYADAQELPALDAIEAVYDIYRAPEPAPLADTLAITTTPTIPSVAIYLDDKGHMVAKDEAGNMVNFDTLALNCAIMSRDFGEMSKMLRKIGDMARKGQKSDAQAQTP